MPRRHKMSRKSSRKSFRRGAARTPRINKTRGRVMRGGYRL